MPKLSSKLSSILLLLLVLALAACSGGGGGGSDGGSDPADDTPDDTPDDNTSEVTLQAIAGPDQSVNEGDEVLLEGSGAVSDTNLSLSYSWQQVGGSAVTLAGGDGQVASFSPTVDADSELSFRLLVQTETGLEATDDLVVSVNNAPTAVSESASSVVEGFAVSLNGWQSLDSDAGSVVAYEWAQLSGASVELSYVDEASVSFTAPWVSGNENLSFELAVTDDDGAIGRATVVIEVLDDTESPSISAIALAAGNYGIGASITLTLTAANSESGLTLKDGSSFNGQELTDFSAVSGQAGSYTATYTVAESDPSRDDGDSVSANIVLLDPAGNESAGIAEVALDGVRIDTLPPAIDSISVSAGDYGIGADVEITLIAADAESDLSLRAGSTFNGQKLANFAALDGQAGYYSAIYTVTSGDPDLAATAKVGMSLVVLDAAGNASSEYETATLSSSTSIDANAPVVASIGVASGDYGIGDEIRIIITAAEAETDLSLSAAANSFNGGTLSQFAHIDSGIYSAIYTVTEGDNDVADNSSASINIALVDAYGNAGAAVSSVLLSNSSIDATKPELSPLSISNGVYGIGSNLVLFLSAAADEVGLELLDSTFNGQNLTGFSDLQNGLYALTYTVAAGDTDRADGVDVAAEISVVDLVGNISQDITSISLSGESIDANAPVIGDINVVARDYGIGDAVEIVISALETGLTLATGSTFNGQELTGFSAIDGQAGDYVVTYTVAEGDSNGSDAGWVDSNIALVDAASNLGEALESVSLGAATIDAHRPGITVIDAAAGEFGVGDEVAITLTASNAETGLVLADGSSFNGGTLSEFRDNGDGTYNVTYTVSEGDLDIADGGTVITDIAFTDDAGNVGASIESLLFAGTSIDANSPSIALVSVAAGSYGVGAVIPVTITASAKELGLSLASSLFNGNNLTNITDNLDGNYSASYTVEEGDADVADGSAVTINLAFEDAYANVGAAKESLILSGASIDANSPTITSVSVATGTFIIGDDVLITITAGDSENGLALKSDSSFNGQQLSDFSATDQDGVYTAVYTVAAEDTSFADGDTVSLDIALLDAVGNESAAVTTIELSGTTIDTIVPSIYEVSVSSDNIVNSSDDLSKVSITGSTSNVEDGRPLTLDIGGITTETSVIADDDDNDNGGFSTTVDLASLSDGTYPITIDVADISGNKAHFTGEFIKDIEPPTIDSVVVSGDDIINSSDTLSAVSVSVGTTGVEDDQNVSLNVGGVMLELAITSNALNGTVDLSGLGDSAEIVVSGDVSDAAGNAADTFTGSLVKDVAAPEILTVLVAGDGIINAAEASAATISGTISGAEAGQQVSMDIGGILATALVDDSGAFAVVVDLSGLSDGAGISLSADVSDTVGNAAETFTRSVVKDVVAPEISTVFVAGDGVINAAEASAATISGATSGAEANQQVSLNVGGISATALVDDSGDFSVVVDLSSLSDGAGISLSADVSDLAGNAAPQFAGSVIVDTTIPGISGVVVSGDDRVNASEIASAVSVSGSTTGAEEGREVSLAIGGVSATALVAADGSFAVDVDLSALSTDGAYQVTADVADSAGNAAPQFVGSVIVDTTIPSIDSVVLSVDDVINASDTLSAVAVSVSTTGVEDDQVVSLDIGGVTAEVAITSNAFDGTVDLSGLGDGTEISVSGAVADLAGNAAEAFTKDSFVLKDTEAPSIDSVVVSGDDKVNATEISSLVAISGTTTGVEEGREISLNIGGEMAAAQVAADGSFAVDVGLSGLSPDATYQVTADVADSAGNAAAQFVGSVIVDTLAPSIDSVVVGGDDKVNASEIASAVSVSGSTTDAEEGREVSLVIGGVSTTTQVAADGSFAVDVDLSGLSSDGTYQVTADVADGAGNAAAQFVGSVIVDTTKPSIDGVVVSGDDKVNATEINSLVAISGITTGVEEGRDISLNVGGETATAQVAADGSFTTDVDLSKLSTDGTYTLSADVSDAAGNAADQFSGSIIVDTSKPSIDSVVVSGDDKVNASEIASAVSVSGAITGVEVGREVSLAIGEVSATASVDDSGNFAVDVDLSSLSPDGTYQVTADVADSAGNSAAQFLGSVIVDTAKPSIDSVVVSGDDKVNASEIASAVSVSGATTGVEVGREVSLTIGGEMATALVAADGSFSTTIDLSSLSSDGAYALGADVADSAGNAAPQFGGSVLIDTTKPVINSVVLSGDDVINTSDTLSAVAVSVATTGVEDGQVVFLNIGGVTADVSITSNAFDGTVDLSGLGDGAEISVSGDVSDLAGNAAETFTKSIVKDTAAPTIAITSVAADGTINALEVGEVEIIGTASEDGQSVLLAISDGADTLEADATVSNNSYSATVDLASLDDSVSISLDVTIADAAGNEASASKTDIVKDTLAPSIDSVLVAGDNVVNSSEKSGSVAVAGSTTGVEDNQVITLIINATNITTTVSGNNFATSADLSGLSDATYTVTANVADAAGNPADVANVDFVMDTTPPTQEVTLASIQLSTDSGTDSTDFITNQATQSIGAELDAILSTGDVLYASVDGGSTWQQVDSANIDGTSIAWSATLLNGTNTIQFQVADAADNNGTIIKKDYTLDTTAPTQSVSAIAFSVDSGTTDDFLTNIADQTITASLSAALGDDEFLFGSVSSNSEADPVWDNITAKVSDLAISWDITLSAGENDIQLKVIDAAGNDGTIAAETYTLDQTAPTIDTELTATTVVEGNIATLDASASSDSNDIASYTWVQVDGASVGANEVADTDDNYVILSPTGDGTATFTAPGIADEDTTATLSLYFQLTLTDTAGNTASTSSPLAITVTNDHTTPAITASVSAPNFDQLSLSWPTTTGLTYDLHRSSAADCDLSATGNCADYELYAAVDLSGGAQIDSGLELFTPYYYWLEAELNGEVVSLSSTPLEANTTGPALNDTGVIQGGDYPSGFDTLGGGVCNGGYLVDDNGDVIADPDNHSGNSTFIAFDNEDCELGRDADTSLNDPNDGNAGFSFTRLNEDGSEYTGSGDYGTDPWSCVLDNVTGLIWEVKTNDNTLRDRDEGFTWYDPDNTTYTGTESSQDTADFVEYFNGNNEVNSGNGLCGQTNWRLPTVQELVGISDFSTYEPVVDTSYFPNARTGASEWSWTADLNSDTANLPGYAWLYSYYTGSTRSGGNGLGTTSSSRYVRLVSSSEVVKSYFNDYSSDGGRYTDHEDGTVSDNRTGLMWMKCIYGQAHNLSDNSCGVTGVGAGGTWQEAFAKVAAINEGVGIFGYTDWRLPNMKELLSLVDLSSFEPPINQGIFPSTDGQSQWTSTLSAQDGGDAALAVGFSADPEFGVVGKTVTTSRFRLVRDDVNTPRILTLDINGDNVINAGDDLVKIPVSGSTSDIEDEQQITLVVGSKTFYIDVSVDGFEDTIDLSGLADGTYSVTADVSDSAGKEANQFTSTLLKDTVLPSINDDLVVAGDDSINSSEVSAATISGTTEGVEDEQILSLAISDGTATVEQTVTVTGNAFSTSANLSSLADGDNLNLTADVADDVGNSAETFTKSITKDTAAPTITIDSVATDGIINASEQSSVVINGTTSGAADDQTVSLALSDGTNTLEATTTVSNNSYSATVDLSSLADGTGIALGVGVADTAGNEASASKTDIIKDTLKPSIASISVADDNVVNSSEKSNSVAVSGSTTGVEDNQVITLTINGSNITANVSSNSFSTSADLSSLNDGTYNLSANVSDAAGNPADEATGSFEVDTTAPEQAVDPDSIQLSTDSGSSASDFITNQATQTISATLSAALGTGDVLYASVDGGSTWQQVDSTNISGTSISWPATLLEGTNTIQFQVADAADNRGDITQQSYTLDTTAPTQSVSSIAFSVDSGTAGDLVTNTASQTITATLSAELETGDLLFGAVSLNQDSTPAWINITDRVTDLAISWDTTLSAGANDIQFIVEDAAGNSGEPAKQSYFFDNEAPKTNTAGTTASTAEASVATLKASNSTDNYGIASYEWTQVQSDGSALSADDIELSIANANDATTTVITPGITDDAIDSLSFYFSLRITDVAGNYSGATATLNVSNTYTTPDITASTGAPNFDQLSLSWPTATGLTYDLHRSTASNCDLSATDNCADYQLYAALDLSGGAQVDSGLDFFSSYYYWLEAKNDGTVVSLSSMPTEANTTGPALNDTGITSGGDYPSGFDSHNGSSAVCDGGYLDADNGNAFAAFAAEDCELGRDATNNNSSDGHAGFSYTRLNADGSEYSGSGDYSTEPWVCVLDNVTGLIWEVKTTIDNTNPSYYDKGYTWHDASATLAAYLNGDNFNNTDGSGLCGRTDWRLPTVQEIYGLTDYAATSTPFIDTGYFPNTQNNLAYWAADLNVNPDLSDYVWAYDPFNDQIFTRSAAQQFTYARLVSSSEAVKSHFSDYSNSRYTDHGDGTVSDTKTGLMWMKCTYGQNYDSAASSICGATTAAIDGDWRDGFINAALVNDASSFGYTDWRLPNIKELGSLVDFNKYEPAAINTDIFSIPSNDTNLYYWSSTPTNNKDAQELLTQALVIGFGTNHGGRYAGSARQTSLTGYLRLVRDDVKTPRILTVNINGDNIINAGDSSNLDAIQVSGSTADVEAGQILSLAINTNAYSTSAEIKEDGSFTATIDLSGIADGTYSVTADVSDSAGEEANQFTSSLLVDTAAPTIASVSATSGTYGIGALVPLTLTASESGLTLTRNSFNGQSLGEVIDNNDGTYTTSYTVVENDTDIADGGSVITDLAFTDPAGNAGTATTSVILSGASIDAHRPTIDSVSVAAGTHGIGDSVAITITAGGNESGLNLTSTTFNGATLGAVTDNGGGTYSTTYVVEEGNPHVADGGAVSVNLAFTDPADNVGIAFNTVTLATGTSIDTTPPTQTISDIDIDDDSGVSDTDFLTNNPTQNISATLSAGLESGDTLRGSVDSGVNWEDITDTSVSGTAITWNSVTLSAGAIQFKVVDAAGNDGDVAGQPYTLDQTNPTASVSDVSANEASVANLDASNSTDNYGIASYEWTQVQSDGSALSADDIELSIASANDATTTVITPGITDDDIDSLSFYFSLKITDVAGNSSGAMATLNVSNTYTTPDITASTGAPNFDQLSLSWPTTTGLTYDLYRSSDSACDLSDATNCADPALYTALDLSGGGQIDIGLDFFSTYYYWLGAQINGEVVSLSPTPLEANTTGPALNDTGVIQGGDYPSGFDTLGGGVCNGGYLVDDNGDVIADPDNHSGNSTFVPFAAEDCELGRDADDTLNDDSDGNAGFSFTRLNIDGSEYSGSGDYGAAPWACVLDNVTGLIWEVKTNDNTLRDRDEGFTWYNSSTAEGTPSAQDTDDFVDYVNENMEVNSGNGLCGQTNWRLPTVQELVGISDFSTYAPVVDTSYFPNARTGKYEWSWTADLNSDTENFPGYAWLYNYETGSTRSGNNNKGATNISYYVRLVSSSEAVESYFNDYSSDGGRYTDHEDGTVSDNRTGLMWMKCIYGQAHNSSDNSCGVTGVGAAGTWQEAFAKIAAINEDVGIFGYTDWRLPNMKELLSLVDLSSFEPPINQDIFPSADGQSQWTSTLSAQDGGDAALAVGFSADPEFGVVGKTVTTSRFRLVRNDVNTPRILTLDINGDNVINSEDELANISVSGSTIDVEDGQQITLNIGSISTEIEVSNNGFSASVNLSTLADGIDIAVTADASDSAGRAADQFTSTLLKDTVAPSISGVLVSGDDTINSSEANAATITGTTEGVEDGQTISIAINDNADPVVKITATASVTGNAFNITNLNLSSLTDGTGLSLTADVADAAGNPATSLSFDGITKDTAAPTITIDSVATDGIINASEQGSVVINGTTSGAANDQTVSLALSDGTNTVDTTTTVSDNSYSVTVDLSSLADGTSIALGVGVADAAGNEASASKTDIVKDTLKPSIVSISVTDDNVVSSSEILSSVAISGATSGVENNQLINLTINGSDITATVISNIFTASADLFGLGEGSHNLTANVSDAAGNPADEATGSFEVDTTAPEQAVDPDSIQLSTDSGSSASDFITNQATQSISATLSAALGTGDVLYASVDGGSTWQQVDSTNISGTSISWPATLLEGTNTIQFQVADSADNNGTIVKKDYTLDTTTPGQSISTIKLSDDSGALNDDFLTNNPTQTISASLSAGLESGDTLHGSVDSGVNWTDITNTSVSGAAITWNSVTLSSGAIQFKVVDASGNDGDVAEQAYILDTTAPTIDTTGTDSAVDEASSATLNASGSDSSGIASYAWVQVESSSNDASEVVSTDDTYVSLNAANDGTATFTAPGIVDEDDMAYLSLYFKITLTDNAGNPATSSPLTIIVDNSYTTPTISASAVGAPDFNQISLSWDANSSLTYSLYRSTDPNCDLSSYTTCANPALYTDSTGITSNDTSASVADTDSSDSFQLFNSYYYWLGGQIGDEVVFLNSTPTIQATNSGPALNDTGITGGGDYPSGFDNHNGLADGVEGAVCNGGYFTDQGAVVSDLSSYSDTSALTFNPFTDEDCELGRDANATLNDDSDGNAAFVFTKLDISGNVLEASATDWTCVLDHTTGLIWEVKTTDGTWRDRNMAFTWYNPNHGQDHDKDDNAITFYGTESDQDTQDFIDYVNSDSSVNSGSGLCGRSNWRLPTVHEIEGLADYDAVVADGSGGYSNPSIDTDYFPYASASQYQWYWTSHLNVDPDVNPSLDEDYLESSTSNYYAWSYGSAESRTRSGTGSTVGYTGNYRFVRLVSSSAAVASHFSDYSDNRYTDNGDGTISDHQTGLMWMKCSYAQTYDGDDSDQDGIICEGSPTFGTWQQAFAWAADSNANSTYGYSDWRLPNIKELGSIVDFGSAKPAINQNIFPNTASGPYWTSTPSRANVHQTIFIGFQAGDYGPSDRISNLYLRLIREP